MMPTSQLVRQNAKSAMAVTKDLLHFRVKKVFIDKNRSELDY
jgi:hypothetical protein